MPVRTTGPVRLGASWPASLRQWRCQVAARAGQRCEYCHTPRAITGQAFHIEHIRPQARGGNSDLDNLAYACPRCNLHKSDRLAAIDPRTQRRAALFHPRQQAWEDHFRWSDTLTRLVGRTAPGRATVAALKLNDDVLVAARSLWVVLDLLP